jgi:antitoxin component YwqK of YwqJK toxin-antitoxin module
LHGQTTTWYSNGQKSYEATFKDDKVDGPWTSWHENGQEKVNLYKDDGKKVGLWTLRYENGQKRDESTWKDGKLVSATVWKPNGEKCPAAKSIVLAACLNNLLTPLSFP